MFAIQNINHVIVMTDWYNFDTTGNIISWILGIELNLKHDIIFLMASHLEQFSTQGVLGNCMFGSKEKYSKLFLSPKPTGNSKEIWISMTC